MCRSGLREGRHARLNPGAARLRAAPVLADPGLDGASPIQTWTGPDRARYRGRMSTRVNMHEAKSNLSALIARVLGGEEITIARAGAPLVDLVPHRPLRVVYGLAPDAADHDPDVFDGHDEEIAEMFYGAQDA